MEAILDFIAIMAYVTAVLAVLSIVAGVIANRIFKKYKFREEWVEIKTVKKYDGKSININEIA